jgi:hypothetical protein
MIIDRTQLAGPDSYFRHPTSGKIDLGTLGGTVGPVTVRTRDLPDGKQLDVSGIQIFIQHHDLQNLMQFQVDAAGNRRPILRIKVVKEMFPGLFADPYSHRVHNVAGFLDFNAGTLTNGRVLDVDGVATIVSTGKEECVWVSKEYDLPEPISVSAIAWELAGTKLVPRDSFHYFIKITSKDSSGFALSEINLGNSANRLAANATRAVEGLNNPGIKSFQITFGAKVFEDSYLMERHVPAFHEKIGRPLLRAINLLENLLEPVTSIYEIHSLNELQGLCSDFHLHETPGPQIKRLTATLDLAATVVSSRNKNIVNNIYDALSRYEYIELAMLHDKFERFEARRVGAELTRSVL